MTELMNYLFEYLQEEGINNYLAADLEYRRNSLRADNWSMELAEHLDEAGQELFEKYQAAEFKAHLCELQAMFQAAMDLCRELNGRLMA